MRRTIAAIRGWVVASADEQLTSGCRALCGLVRRCGPHLPNLCAEHALALAVSCCRFFGRALDSSETRS